MAERSVEAAVAALRAGKPVVVPTDTVYGLVGDGYREAPARRLFTLKGRPEGMPCALLASDLELILDAIPELRGRSAVMARALLPGPYTLVLANPGRRFRWLCGATPTAIGIRVPALGGAARAVIERAGVVAATSANVHGRPDPRRLDEVPPELLEAAGASVDGGTLPGTPSTVLDLTGPEPRVVREGAGSVSESLERLRATLG